MKVYLAAPYTYREKMSIYAAHLRERGHIVTARWLDREAEDNGFDGVTHEQVDTERLFAEAIVEDIDRSDALIFFAEPPRSVYSRGGRHFEMGLAWGKGKRIITIGHRENIFHSLSGVEFVPCFLDALDALDATVPDTDLTSCQEAVA